LVARTHAPVDAAPWRAISTRPSPSGERVARFDHAAAAVARPMLFGRCV
jgi:hypothetical protein